MKRAILSLCLVLWTGTALADTVTIDVVLDSPISGSYRLSGQSAFIQTQTGASTSGGQLDGVQSPVTSISFEEVFPPPTLADYLGFAYFGILQTLDEFDEVIDTSLVVAFNAGSGVGTVIGDTFPYDEATLVAAFTGGDDSLEFLDMLGLVPANASTLGDTAVPPVGRPGTLLDLVAFIGDDDGDVGVKIGTLGVTVVPEPSTLSLLVIGAAGLLAVRRRLSRHGNTARQSLRD
jgi:hypothetical protein